MSLVIYVTIVKYNNINIIKHLFLSLNNNLRALNLLLRRGTKKFQYLCNRETIVANRVNFSHLQYTTHVFQVIVPLC